MKALLIPIKDPANAKSRLSGLLSQEERRVLAWAMFEDVAKAITEAVKPESVAIASNYQPAISFARARGWNVLLEESQQSESASVDWASRILESLGFETVMRLPADIPLVTAADIDALLSIDLNAPSAVLVPSRDGTGTNAILRNPPSLFPSRFGPDSLALHRLEASRVGTECLIVENDRIALDIDEPADIDRFLQLGEDSSAYRLLQGMDLARRSSSEA
jgi:2-phospho-L-lactate guanylyltransferase